MLDDERLEPRNCILVSSQREVDVPLELECAQTSLPEAFACSLVDYPIGQIREWRSAPEPEGLTQLHSGDLGLTHGVSRLRLVEQQLEAEDVQLRRLDVQRVARPTPRDPVATQQLPEAMNVDRQCVRCAVRGSSPQRESIASSRGTTSLARNRNNASNARCFCGPSFSGPVSVLTSSGPRSRKFMRLQSRPGRS